jgi:hypothetical protein
VLCLTNVLAWTKLNVHALDIEQLVLTLKVVEKVILIETRALLKSNARLTTGPNKIFFVLIRVVIDF